MVVQIGQPLSIRWISQTDEKIPFYLKKISELSNFCRNRVLMHDLSKQPNIPIAAILLRFEKLLSSVFLN